MVYKFQRAFKYNSASWWLFFKTLLKFLVN